MPMIGILTAWATCQTMRNAMGLMAGPTIRPISKPAFLFPHQ